MEGGRERGQLPNVSTGSGSTCSSIDELDLNCLEIDLFMLHSECHYVITEMSILFSHRQITSKPAMTNVQSLS